MSIGTLQDRWMAIAISGSAVAAVVGGIGARYYVMTRPHPVAIPKRPSYWLDSPERVLHVPHMPGGIILDGDADDPGWTGTPAPARTHELLLPNGTPARPFSEVRVVWGDGYLYLCLYAADENIESRTTTTDGPLWLDDVYRVVFSKDGTDYAIETSPRATITDSIRHGGGAWDYTWSSHAHASSEMDGTLNEPNNMDEEWVIELAVPFDAIGLQGRSGETIDFTASRCDTPKDGPRVCSHWGDGTPPGRIVLD